MPEILPLRPLGSTGLKVSPMGLGLAALGRPGYINLGHGEDFAGGRRVSDLEHRTHQLLDLAWQSGIRYFDMARSYGRAEAFMGSWKGFAPGVVTGSKWGYFYTADWQVKAEKHEIKDHSLSLLQKQWGETQKALGRAPQLYQIHSATFSSLVLENDEVLDELARMKASQGVAIGLSVSGPDQPALVERALEIQRDGKRLFDTIQATWNVLEPSAGPMLAEAHRQGMGVIIKEALANGRLTDRNTAPGFAPRYKMLVEASQRLGCTLDGLVLAAALAQPWSDVVLSGAATMAQLTSNLQAFKLTLDPLSIALLAGLAEEPQDYWKTRSSLAWN